MCGQEFEPYLVARLRTRVRPELGGEVDPHPDLAPWANPPDADSDMFLRRTVVFRAETTRKQVLRICGKRIGTERVSEPDDRLAANHAPDRPPKPPAKAETVSWPTPSPSSRPQRTVMQSRAASSGTANDRSPLGRGDCVSGQHKPGAAESTAGVASATWARQQSCTG